MGPLQGIRVLDLTRLLPGPFATMVLADFGAEVIKVEDPILGDYYRALPPLSGSQGASFNQLNRNKKSVCVNLKSDLGREAFLLLVKEADVVVESFRPGVMDRLGVGYQVLRGVNQGIILASLSGFGQEGPYRSLPGHDLNYIAMAGALDLTGMRGGPPAMPGVQIADIGGGALPLIIGILLALRSRDQTGMGQYVDISMFDGVLAWLVPHFAHYFATGEVPARGEMRLNGRFPWYYVYETKDGRFLAVGALEHKFWHNLCHALQRPDLIPAFNGEAAVLEQTRLELQEMFRQKTQSEWVECLADKDCCVTPVRNLAEVVRDVHVKERGMLQETGTGMSHIGPFIKLSATPGRIKTPAPGFGQHTEEILSRLGYSPDEIGKISSPSG
ncbi:MAG: CaiB/BaiF CoA transferase family protein [Bacillota bacterium]